MVVAYLIILNLEICSAGVRLFALRIKCLKPIALNLTIEFSIAGLIVSSILSYSSWAICIDLSMFLYQNLYVKGDPRPVT